MVVGETDRVKEKDWRYLGNSLRGRGNCGYLHLHDHRPFLGWTQRWAQVRLYRKEDCRGNTNTNSVGTRPGRRCMSERGPSLDRCLLWIFGGPSQIRSPSFSLSLVRKGDFRPGRLSMYAYGSTPGGDLSLGKVVCVSVRTEW